MPRHMLLSLIIFIATIPQPGWSREDNALLLLKSADYSRTEALVAALEGLGAHAAHIIPPRGIIAQVPPAAEEAVRSLPDVAALYRGPAPSFDKSDGSDLAAASQVWNHLIAQPSVLESVEAPGSPLAGDAFEPPDRMAVPLIAPAGAPGTSQTSEFMVGKVAVGIILPESAGNGENWTTSRQNAVYNEIVAGLNWWVANRPAGVSLTFYYDTRFSVPTQYEPITRTDESTWVADVFANMGYTSGTAIDRARAYDNYLRNTLHTDWAYCFIVVDDLNDSDNRFPNGYFAWAYLGGPYVIMTYDNDGWGIGNMDRVAKHETGHIFLAGDEYCQPGYYCCDFGYYGYLNVYNGNCEDGNPSSVPCVMRSNENAICQYTRGQIGWQDSDDDNLPDVIDNTVSNSLNAPTSPTRLLYVTFIGTAADIPCVSPTRTDVTINKIPLVRFRVDGGEWAEASASDGAFDEDIEGYTFVAPLLSAGTHTVETQAFSTSGNASAISSRTVEVQNPDLTPPVMGAVNDEGDTFSDETRLYASWSATEDPDSGITEYKYAIGTSPTDPGSGYARNWTSTGTTTFVTATGLNLVDGQTYYFYVKAKNVSGVWSDAAVSDGITLVRLSLGQVKELPVGRWVSVKERVATSSTFSSPYAHFYIEDADRSGGLRVKWGSYIASGSLVTVKGTIGGASSTTGYERELVASSCTVISTGNPIPNPLSMNTRAIGGTAFNAQTPGVYGGIGLNNLGLLVRVAGVVVKKYSTYFYIDDGAGRLADGAEKGIRVSSSVTGIAEGDMVVVTGVLGGYVPPGWTEAIPMIKTRSSSDVIKP